MKKNLFKIFLLTTSLTILMSFGVFAETASEDIDPNSEQDSALESEDTIEPNHLITKGEIVSAATIIYQNASKSYIVDSSNIEDVPLTLPEGFTKDDVFLEFTDPTSPSYNICIMQNKEQIILHTMPLSLKEVVALQPAAEKISNDDTANLSTANADEVSVTAENDAPNYLLYAVYAIVALILLVLISILRIISKRRKLMKKKKLKKLQKPVSKPSGTRTSSRQNTRRNTKQNTSSNRKNTSSNQRRRRPPQTRP